MAKMQVKEKRNWNVRIINNINNIILIIIKINNKGIYKL